MGVQVGVTSTGVAVLERGREQSGGVQLLHPVAPATGVDRVAFQPRQDVFDGGVVRRPDLLATSTGAIAHNAETLLTGVKVRSNPATAVVAARECRAMNEDSSRGSFGGRAYWAVNMSRPTSVRIRARSAAASGQSRGIPNTVLTCAHRRATSTRNAGAVSITANGCPSRIAASTSSTRPVPPARRSISAWVIASAFGCLPSANKAVICSAVTSCPVCRSTSARAEPSHTPGDSPRWV